jgi:hypothetical protein
MEKSVQKRFSAEQRVGFIPDVCLSGLQSEPTPDPSLPPYDDRLPYIYTKMSGKFASLLIPQRATTTMEAIFKNVRTSRYLNNVTPVRRQYADSYGTIEMVWAARESQLGGKSIPVLIKNPDKC